ncbi:MAG: ABC transporter substrate-binding protein, partial [Verrucomicrobiales bacterium]|nr:ABC transporter substrate-binding protein [Verrucomicrobiales bacterium]
MPLLHAAPLLVAKHLGYFANHGIQVRLSAEVGWATIREKIISGELDAAQALAPMPLSMALGRNSVRCDCLTALVLVVHGNTLVLSRRLWDRTGGDPVRFAAAAAAGSPPPTFGVV